VKLTTEDNRKLRAAIAACKLADIDLAVIAEGKIRGLSESRNAVIFSDLVLSIDPEIQLGITRLSELDKRLALFGDDILVEGDLTDAKKVRKLAIRGKAGKIEFRCTDVAMLDKKYPKENHDVPGTVITFSKAEIALISRGVKTLGAEQLTIQVKRDGAVHIESLDTSNDRFETDLVTNADFIDDAVSSVFSYNSSSSGVLLGLLEHTVKDAESSQIILMKSGNIGVTVFGFDIIAIPRIITGV